MLQKFGDELPMELYVEINCNSLAAEFIENDQEKKIRQWCTIPKRLLQFCRIQQIEMIDGDQINVVKIGEKYISDHNTVL